jgi:hypothetical protein
MSWWKSKEHDLTGDVQSPVIPEPEDVEVDIKYTITAYLSPTVSRVYENCREDGDCGDTGEPGFNQDDAQPGQLKFWSQGNLYCIKPLAYEIVEEPN